MSLGYLYSCSAEAVRQWPSDSRPLLDRLCRQIQEGERTLNEAAAGRLHGCLKECRGLCCRNLDLEAVFGVPDFVYMRIAGPTLDAAVAECLRREIPIFTSNCPFLENGLGPCIFPPDVRPEVCITSFCGGDDGLGAAIRTVKTGFWKLGVALRTRRVPLIHRLLDGIF
jgi:hypothetical protein